MAKKAKHETEKNTATNSIKTLKVVHVEIKILKNKTNKNKWRILIGLMQGSDFFFFKIMLVVG